MKALRTGLSVAARNSRLLCWLLIGNLVLALLAVFPLIGPFEDSLAHHEAAKELTRRFDMSWWVDLTTSRAEVFSRALDGVALSAFLAVVMGCFFAGGMIQTYQDSLAGLAMDRFMTSCRKWFFRFAWLLTLSLPFYWLAHRLVNRGLSAWFETLFESVEDERLGLTLTLTRAILFLILFDMITLMADYARVHAIVRAERSMLACLIASVRFMMRHPMKVCSLEMGVLGMQVLALILYLPIDALFTRNSAVGLAAGLFAGQCFLLLRLFVRETSRAGQVALYRDTF